MPVDELEPRNPCWAAERAHDATSQSTPQPHHRSEPMLRREMTLALLSNRHERDRGADRRDHLSLSANGRKPSCKKKLWISRNPEFTTVFKLERMARSLARTKKT